MIHRLFSAIVLTVAFLLLGVLVTTLVIPDANAYCRKRINFGACQSCTTSFGPAAQGSGGFCNPCGYNCVIVRPGQGADTNPKIIAQALGGAPYAYAMENTVVVINDPSEAGQFDAVGRESEPGVGIEMDYDMIREIAQEDKVAAGVLLMFHPSKWTPPLNLLAGSSVTNVLITDEYLEKYMISEEASLEETHLQAAEGAYIEIRWNAEEVDDDTLKATFLSKAVDDPTGSIPIGLVDTATTVWLSKSPPRLISYTQTPKED